MSKGKYLIGDVKNGMCSVKICLECGKQITFIDGKWVSDDNERYCWMDPMFGSELHYPSIKSEDLSGVL